MTTSWQELLTHKDYAQIAVFYQELIDMDADQSINYFYLGLALLLQSKKEEAQATWNLGLQKKENSTDFNYEELINILEQESTRQEALREYQVAWDIRKFIKQIEPERYDNSAKICVLSLHLKTFNIELLRELGFIKTVVSDQDFDSDSLLKFLLIYVGSYILKEIDLLEEYLELLRCCIPYFSNKQICIQALILISSNYLFDIALKLANTFSRVYPDDRKSVLPLLSILYTRNRDYDKAIQIAREMVLECPDNALEKANFTYGLLLSLMERGGDWHELEMTFKELRSLHRQIVEQYTEDCSESDLCIPLSVTPFFAPYFEDDPRVNHVLQTQVLHLFGSVIRSCYSYATKSFQAKHIALKPAKKQRQKTQKIKIGYLTSSLRQHSVGWLARSLFQHFDHESFEIYGYFPTYNQGRDFLEEWYVSSMDFVFRQGVEYFNDNSMVLAEQINQNEIDILIDLESLTSPTNLNVLALKPAPIQVSWLGWNASGLPTVDYYIADPYVLPEDAQEYYSEKIWRLPHTYIATDGFECTTITLRRQDLGIPDDAITYFCSQRGYKRHPETVKAQLQIIRQVPNSYFLIKGLADENFIQKFFYELAEIEGVEKERLVFLPFAKSENEHRANMAIADVVLDTYPYNGATTTMETLWMGIPMVTRVGEQFAARNSYTMMMNVGVTEGIAHNVEEYIDWGVRFGTDESLRRDVAWKLRQSRQTSPLWDGRQFAREMENAYRQMWEIYNEQS